MACGKEERREEAKNTEARLRGLASTLSWAWSPFLGEQSLLPASQGRLLRTPTHQGLSHFG